MKNLWNIRFEAFYLVIGLLLGLLFVFITPPNATPDEIAHQVKVVRVASGNLFGVDKNLDLPDILAWYQPFSNAKMLNPPYNFKSDEVKAVISQDMICDSQSKSASNGISSYSPLPYALSAINYKLSCSLKLPFGVYLYSSKIISLFVSLLLVYMAMKVAPNLKFIFFTVALLPTVMYQFSAIAADSFLISMTMLYIAYICRYLHQKNKKDIAFIFLTGTAVCFSKPAYAWLVLLALPVVAEQFMKKPTISWIKTLLLIVVVPVSVHFIFLLLSKGAAPHVVTVEENIAYLKSHPLSLFTEMFNTPFYFPFGDKWNIYESLIGKLGWLTIPMPKWCYYSAVMNFILLAFIGENEYTKITRCYLIAISIFSIIVISLPLYLFATNQPFPAIFGLQGRYFIPTLTIFLAAMGGTVNIRKPRIIEGILVVSVVAMSAAAIYSVYNAYY